MADGNTLDWANAEKYVLFSIAMKILLGIAVALLALVLLVQLKISAQLAALGKNRSGPVVSYGVAAPSARDMAKAFDELGPPRFYFRASSSSDSQARFFVGNRGGRFTNLILKSAPGLVAAITNTAALNGYGSSDSQCLVTFTDPRRALTNGWNFSLAYIDDYGQSGLANFHADYHPDYTNGPPPFPYEITEQK